MRLSPGEGVNASLDTLFIVCLWAEGVPGDAEAVGHPASPGAGEGEADASGAAEAHDPDESPDACVLSALRSGTCMCMSRLIHVA